MDEPGKIDARHMAGMGEHARNIPDGFLGFRKMFGQESTTILFRKESVKAPQTVLQRPDIENIDDHQIARFRALDTDGSGQEMDLGQIDIADI